MESLLSAYENFQFRRSRVLYANCIDVLAAMPKNSVHAIVTDPPYGFKEYEITELEKREKGTGGVWRIPPSFDGNMRAPLPRFTALDAKDKEQISTFFERWASICSRTVCPGAHIFVASNSFIVPILMKSIINSGLEFRGQIIRQVRTLRGGDRPKNAEQEFPFVSSLPRGGYEPWLLFRKPLSKGMTVSENLRRYGTGGLRRLPDGKPFCDLILSERTPRRERDVADHPSLKQQSFMRLLCYAALPLGRGLVVDPFSGSGSTIAAAEAVGVTSLGIERHKPYYDMSKSSIPKLLDFETEIDRQIFASNGHSIYQKTNSEVLLPSLD